MSLNNFSDKVPLSSEVRLAVFLLIIVGLLSFLGNLFKKAEPIAGLEVPIRATSFREISRGNITKKQVIFTFDGGDGDASAGKVLSVLAKHRIKGSFFLTGKFMENHTATTKQIFSSGHEIFNHTYNHPHLRETSNRDISLEMRGMERILRETIGTTTTARPYFRAPYGERDARVIADAFREGYQSVFWTVDAEDWRESEGKTGGEVKNIILSSLAPGNIYLMHLGDNITGNILDEVFTDIESQGYKIVSLTEGL